LTLLDPPLAPLQKLSIRHKSLEVLQEGDLGG
jgi:hypothetical protein